MDAIVTVVNRLTKIARFIPVNNDIDIFEFV